MLYQFFIGLQIVLFFYITLHDWIDFPPFTNKAKLFEQYSYINIVTGSLLYALIVGIPLLITIIYPNMPFWAACNIFIFYMFTTIGTIASWWIPYFFGSSQKHKIDFKIFANTHTFLPPRGDNIVPNTVHIVLHIQIWICFLISMYYLYQSFQY